VKEYDRARAIYKYALDQLPRGAVQQLYETFNKFEKQHGSRCVAVGMTGPGIAVHPCVYAGSCVWRSLWRSPGGTCGVCYLHLGLEPDVADPGAALHHLPLRRCVAGGRDWFRGVW
jgi:hypothetical protein